MGMIKGMTGFGCAEFSYQKMTGLVEIKSVNHRFLDVTYYLPTGFASIEDKIRQILNNNVERGRINVAIKITNKPGVNITFNKQAASTYLKYADTLKKRLNLSGDLSIAQLIQMPGVFETKETFFDAQILWPSIEKAIRISLKSLLLMRQREGKSLARDISRQLKLMSGQLGKIQARAKIVLKEKKKTLVADEFSSVQKSSDVNEEIARLGHHIKELELLLRVEKAVGKKLDFIAQEMQRETNTIGSKLQDGIVSNAVIALKSKIEKIREQSQNVE